MLHMVIKQLRRPFQMIGVLHSRFVFFANDVHRMVVEPACVEGTVTVVAARIASLEGKRICTRQDKIAFLVLEIPCDGIDAAMHDSGRGSRCVDEGSGFIGKFSRIGDLVKVDGIVVGMEGNSKEKYKKEKVSRNGIVPVYVYWEPLYFL
jgi:hypothetical protein